jgi:hypothetical protein
VTTLTLEAGEVAQRLAAGSTVDTTLVDAGALDRLETMVAGVSAVANPEPAFRPAAEATTSRAPGQGALHGVVRAPWTRCASVLSVPGSRAWRSGVPERRARRGASAYSEPDGRAPAGGRAHRETDGRDPVLSPPGGGGGGTGGAALAGTGVSGAEL